MPLLTYRQISERLGISRGAAKMIVIRRGWQKVEPNKAGGTVLVQVPDDFDGARAPRSDRAPGTVPLAVTPVVPTVPASVPHDVIPMAAHREVVSTLQDQIAQEREEGARRLAEQHARADADRARSDAAHAAELSRVASLHLDLVGRLQAAAAAERSLFLERVDAAEVRAERVEERLDQVLDVLLDRQGQPWWRRWFGESKRSKLG